MDPKIFQARCQAAQLLMEAGDLDMAEHILKAVTLALRDKPKHPTLNGYDVSSVVETWLKSDRSQFVEFIKSLRTASGAGLKDAKDYAENYR